MQETNLVFFNLENKIPIEKELLAHYKDDINFTAHSVVYYDVLLKSVNASGKSLVIGKIENRSDFICLVKLLKATRRKIKNNSLKVAVLNLTHNKKVEKILSSYQCHDFLSLNMSIKTYFFKIDFWARALKSDLVEQEKKKFKVASQNVSINAREEKKIIPIIFEPALEKKEDIWVLKNKNDCKKILKRWLVRMKGPSPHVCLWERVIEEEDSTVSKWKLIFKAGFDLHAYGMEEGDWFFTGTRPEFDWKRGDWIFSGEEICLYFHSNEREFKRFFLFEEKLTIYENDEFALAKEELLDKTRELKIVEKLALKEEKKKGFDAKKTAFGHYRGNTKNNEDLGGHYSGSVKVVSNEVQDNNGVQQASESTKELKGVVHELFNEIPDYVFREEKSTFEIKEKELLESGKILVEIRQLMKGEEKIYLSLFEDLFETELVTLFKKEFSLELAPVKVNLFFSYLDQKVEIKDIQGQIVEIEEYNEENHLAVIDLLKIPELDLKRLMQLYFKRQKAINVFMQKAKGF